MGVDPTIAVAFITGSFGLAGVVAANRKVNRRLDQVHDQVANTHTTNLREDIDRVLHSLGDVREDIAQMREEAAQERRERVELGWQVDRHLREHRAA